MTSDVSITQAESKVLFEKPLSCPKLIADLSMTTTVIILDMEGQD